jgi:uncharacterized protein (TIGR02246 family)
MGLSTEDLLAIQGLAARYSHAVDSGDVEEYLGAFTEDGVFEIVGTAKFEGHGALKALPESFANSPGIGRHIANNLIIEGDGDHATLKAYVHVVTLLDDQFTVTTGGIYNDTLVKRDGVWKFSNRTFTSDKLIG